MVEAGSAPSAQVTAQPGQPGQPGQPTLRWSSRARTLEGIQEELGKIWARPPGATPAGDDRESHVAARTSVLNLVVIVRRPEVGMRVASTISELTGRHPSRTLIVSAADPDGPSWLDAQIQAFCVVPREDAAETCAEMIYLTAGGEAGRHLQSLVAPLLVHDLPVTVWVPGEPLFESSRSSRHPRHVGPPRRRRVALEWQRAQQAGRARHRCHRPDRGLGLRADAPVALARGDRGDVRRAAVHALPALDPPDRGDLCDARRDRRPGDDQPREARLPRRLDRRPAGDARASSPFGRSVSSH